VFFSSHIMSEVQSIADRVAMIREGVIVEVADTQALIDRALVRATVQFKQSVDNSALADVPGVTVLSWDDHSRVTLQVQGDMDALIRALGNYPVRELHTARPSLEEVFLNYYKGSG
jgi:ABC-2 type transport system ATP-binding protein